MTSKEKLRRELVIAFKAFLFEGPVERGYSTERERAWEKYVKIREKYLAIQE